MFGCADDERLLHHAIHHCHILRLDHTTKAGAFALINQRSIGFFDAHDDMRLHTNAAIGKGCIGRDNFKRCDFGCT